MLRAQLVLRVTQGLKVKQEIRAQRVAQANKAKQGLRVKQELRAQ